MEASDCRERACMEVLTKKESESGGSAVVVAVKVVQDSQSGQVQVKK